MSLTREEAHKLIDRIFDAQPQATVEFSPPEEPEKELPKDKRVVRTKTSGDRVYFLDETKKTRQWVTGPELIDQLGFTMADIVEVEDAELMKYQMAGPIYKINA